MFSILVDEDDDLLNKLFSNRLKHENYIDLIICDVMMPVMDGYEFTRLLREANNITPVLMITAKDQMKDLNLASYVVPTIIW